MTGIFPRQVQFATAITESDGAALRERLIELRARIEIGPDSITLSVSQAALARHLCFASDCEADQRLTCERPLMLRKRGQETKLVLGDVIVDERDEALITLIANARIWMQRLRSGHATSIRALARELALDHRHVTRALPLAFLAPDIVRAIVEGRQQANVTVTTLKRFDPFPIRWDDQRAALGMPATA